MAGAHLSAVTWPAASWGTVAACVLASARRLALDGDRDGARELLTKLIPTLTYAAEGYASEIKALEAQVREELGEYVSEDVVSVCRAFVEHFGDGDT